MIDSNKINREALETVQRASMNYTFLNDSLEIKKLVDGDVTNVVFVLNWENSGSTPAIDLATSFNGKVEPPPANRSQISPTEEEFIGILNNPARETIGPRAPLQSRRLSMAAIPILGKGYFEPHPAVNEGLRMQLVPLLWSWVVYRDVFSGTPIRLSEWCGYISDVRRTANPTLAPDFTVEPCAKHNCTDQYCEDYEQIIKHFN